MKDLSKRPAALQEAVFKRLFDTTDIESMTASERISYIKEMTTERDIRNQIKYARKEGIEEGKVEGIAEGMAQGKAEGIAEGMAQGKAEIARNMLADGLDAKKIAAYTGLTEEQVKAL